MSTILEEAPIAEAPQEEFWGRYNKRFEFPLSTIAAVLIHLGVVALLMLILVHLMNGSHQNGGVPILTAPGRGWEDGGEGRAEDGGEHEPRKEKSGDPWESSLDPLPDPEKLPEVKDNLRKLIEDETGAMPISSANVGAY